MTEFEHQLLARLDKMADDIAHLRENTAAINERCPNHERQLSDLWDEVGDLRKRPDYGDRVTALERKRNGVGSAAPGSAAAGSAGVSPAPSSSIDLKTLLIAIAAFVMAAATAILTHIGAK